MMSLRFTNRYSHMDIPKGYTPWFGGDCPVDRDEVITIFWGDGDCEVEAAGDWRWDHIGGADHEGVFDIVGYCRLGATYGPVMPGYTESEVRMIRSWGGSVAVEDTRNH